MADPIFLEDDSLNKSKYRAFMANRTRGDDVLAAVSQGLVTRDVTVTAAQMLDLIATPVILIPAPGANLTLSVEGIVAKYEFVTTAYTLGAAADLTFQYTNQTGNARDNAVLNAGFIDQTNDEFRWVWQEGQNTVKIIPNDSYELAAQTADVTLGDGLLHLKLYYRVLETDL